jgi:hypothetical protein
MNRSIRKIWKQGNSNAITLDSDYIKDHNPDYLEELHFKDGEILLLPLNYPQKEKDRLIQLLDKENDDGGAEAAPNGH